MAIGLTHAPTNVGERRHRKAEAEARKRDRAFFRCNPHRTLRVRPSLPFEGEAWGPNDHKQLPFMLVYCSPDGSIYARHGITKAIPNDQEFLSSVWREFEHRRDGRDKVSFTGEQALGMLTSAGLEGLK